MDPKPDAEEEEASLKTGRPTRFVCDGTTADYKRHRRRNEPACPASKRAWRRYYAARRGKKGKKQ